jgi:spore coat protein U-like protein
VINMKHKKKLSFLTSWIPAFAGMTVWMGLLPYAFAGTCYLSASNVSFGRYIRTNPSLNSTGTFYVTCTDSLSYTYCVQLTTGTPRRMTRTVGGTQTLNYQLYRDAARTNIWTDSSCVMVTKSCPFSSPCQEIAYAQVPTGQNKPAGTYQGIISASLNINPTIVLSYAQAYINNGCSVSSDLFNFGAYNPYSSTSLDVNHSNLHVTCDTGRAYTIGLSAGNSGNINARYLVNGANHLLYNFYTSAAYSTIWGAASVSGNGTGAIQNISVYGRIPIHQYLPNGGYMDTITATITFN